jgi:radical SAM protein with 4Fe4S-binding SPASM domain
MMVCADGKVIPCEQMPETEEYFCGDLSRESIQEVWDSDRLRERTYGLPREKFRGNSCYDCDERDRCLGVEGYCIRDISQFRGNMYQPPIECPKSDLPFLRDV